MQEKKSTQFFLFPQEYYIENYQGFGVKTSLDNWEKVIPLENIKGTKCYTFSVGYSRNFEYKYVFLKKDSIFNWLSVKKKKKNANFFS